MSIDDKFLVLLDKISEIGERTARMEVEQQHVKAELEQVTIQDIEQNKLLAEHIQGVKTANARLDNEIQARKLIEENQKELGTRVSNLEVAPKFRATLKQYLIGTGAIATAVVAIFKLLKAIGF